MGMPDSPLHQMLGFEQASDTGLLTFPYYYAQVVGNSVDPNRAGFVQARISGVTDKWKDEQQPWVGPQLTTGMQQVPAKGHWLLVRFIDGDINQGLYYGVSQTKNFLPKQYVDNYPDVAVMNMGESDYIYMHNRRTHTTTVRNPGNNSELTWNAAGEVSLTSSNASTENSVMPVSVLTESTIDIFTCRPIGSPTTGVRTGSEYLRVPHISRQTIDALRGSATSAGETTVKSEKDSEIDGLPTQDIIGQEGTYSVPFMESPAAKVRRGKTNKRIILSATGDAPLAEFLANYTDDNAKNCAHYLVGLGKGDPDVLSELKSKKDARNLGFIQCVSINDDCTLGADMLGKPNLDAVGIVFYGDGNLNDYQMEKFLDIVNHVKTSGNLKDIEVVAYKSKRVVDPRNLYAANLLSLEGDY